MDWSFLSNLLSPIAALIGGGLAGAGFNAWWQGRQAAKAKKSILAALRSEVERSKEIAAYNVRVYPLRARAFMRFPTTAYEQIRFASEYDFSAHSELLDLIKRHLLQANYVNSLISMFEAAIPHDREAGDTGISSGEYINDIVLYCSPEKETRDYSASLQFGGESIPATLDKLAAELDKLLSE